MVTFYKKIKEINSLSPKFVYSPYIKLEALKKINASNSIEKIVVAWHKIDLIKGVSDIEIYNYCKQNNIKLYRNPKIHLKVLWDGNENIILGSANITNKGLGFSISSNLELSVRLSQVDKNTKDYLQEIIESSILIDDRIFKQIQKQLKIDDNKDIPSVSDFELLVKEEDYFLLSQLPQSYSPEYLLAITKSNDREGIDKECFENDLKTYGVIFDNDKQFLSDLKYEFNRHPFVKKFKEFIISRGSERYGGVVQWIQENTTEVPIPRRFEIKQDGIVNILYRWICFFDDNFYWDIPGSKSQVIHFKNVDLVNSLNRDNARGNLAPHQIILLITLSKFVNTNKTSINIEELISNFNSIWKTHQTKFKTKNCNIGLPLKVFYKKEFINITFNKKVNDFRNNTELLNKVSIVTIQAVLVNYLKNCDENYLISRITK